MPMSQTFNSNYEADIRSIAKHNCHRHTINIISQALATVCLQLQQLLRLLLIQIRKWTNVS